MSTIDDIGRQLLGIALGGACVFSTNCATAQITPDKTLGTRVNGSLTSPSGKA
ncbi:MAG: hypothetical protein PUP92_37500 [Rhizonema sp. PD38]|nr:hypothetical protein [Rhizonema sp. PD38]